MRVETLKYVICLVAILSVSKAYATTVEFLFFYSVLPERKYRSHGGGYILRFLLNPLVIEKGGLSFGIEFGGKSYFHKRWWGGRPDWMTNAGIPLSRISKIDEKNNFLIEPSVAVGVGELEHQQMSFFMIQDLL